MDFAPRFRFAPSPTGPVHIGNMHTAVFCWALARSMGGDFILRLEDTDTERNTAAATALIYDAMNWLHIDWDEGPDIGGDYGPYVQSERLKFHQQAIAQLLHGNHAYYGDNPDHSAAPDGNPLRLRLPRNGETVLYDAIRGEIRFDNSKLADPVIVRSDGRPLYHLAAMVDDHDMAITHVVRGEDWIATAPIHIQLYRALGWDEPVWIHLPFVLNKRGQKLKKRDPEGGYLVSDFQAAGYLPEAVWNYLLLLGWSPDGEQELVDRWTVRKQFRLERLSASASVFDWDKLNWVNRQYLHKLSDEKLAEMIRPYLEDVYGDMPVSGDWLLRLTAVIRDEMDKLEDAVDLSEWAFDDVVRPDAAAQAALASDSARPVLARLVAEIAHVVLLDESTATTILNGLRQQFQASHGWGPPQIFHPIRAALTGKVQGRPLPTILGLLGKERTLLRLAEALKNR